MALMDEKTIKRWQQLLEKQIDFFKTGLVNQAYALGVETDSLISRYELSNDAKCHFEAELLNVKDLYEKLMLIAKSDMATVKTELKSSRKTKQMLGVYKSGVLNDAVE